MSSDPWAVFDYEVQMIQGLAPFLNEHEMSKISWALRNAITESAALHTRILCELLLSRGTKPDDIRLSELLPGIPSATFDALNTAYGKGSDPSSPCWQFNKLLAHATKNRSTSHNYGPALTAVWPAMVAVLAAVAVARPSAPQKPITLPTL